MKVTRVKIENYTPDNNIMATATVVLDDSLCIHHIHVIKGSMGEFVSFPNTGLMKPQRERKRYADIVHPCNESLREDIVKKVLEKYREQETV